MCLAVPAKVVEIYDDLSAAVDYLGCKRQVGISLVPGVRKGDWVLIHAGYALEIVNGSYAEESLKLWKEIENGMGSP